MWGADDAPSLERGSVPPITQHVSRGAVIPWRLGQTQCTAGIFAILPILPACCWRGSYCGTGPAASVSFHGAWSHVKAPPAGSGGASGGWPLQRDNQKRQGGCLRLAAQFVAQLCAVPSGKLIALITHQGLVGSDPRLGNRTGLATT